MSQPSPTWQLRTHWPRPAQASGRLLKAAAGVVYVEFLFAIFPLLFAFFGFTQLALIITAKIVVQHAATRAARAAVVVLDDDPKRYNDEKRREIIYREQSNQQSPPAASPGVLGQALGMGGGSIGGGGNSARGNARLNAIRTAAYMPLGAIAPSPDRMMRGFGMSAGALGDLGNGARFLAGMLLYNRAAAVITLRQEPGSNVIADSFPSTDALVTAHVTYLYFCGMPFADLFLCDSALDLTGYGQVLDSVNTISDRLRSGDFIGAADEMGQIDNKLGEAQKQFDSLKQELRYAEAPEFLIPFLASSARFRVIKGEASMPNQGACYYEDSSCYGGATTAKKP